MSDTLVTQQTIAKPARVEGFGYWSGRDVGVEFRPAPADTGIVFVRGDLVPAVRIPAQVEYRIEAPRRTTLVSDGAGVEMVEHILAALAGLGVQNCEVAVDQPEMPGGDGSSLLFVDALLEAGLVDQRQPRARLIVNDVTRVGDDQHWIEARPARRGGLWIEYRLDYGWESAIGRQTLQLAVDRQSFQHELAPARTFLLKEEADWLRSCNVGERVTWRDVLVFDDAGPIENELRFEDECVRHKALDLVGDLSLAGCEVCGEFVAHRSGHRLNADLVRALLDEGQIVTERTSSAGVSVIQDQHEGRRGRSRERRRTA